MDGKCHGSELGPLTWQVNLNVAVPPRSTGAGTLNQMWSRREIVATVVAPLLLCSRSGFSWHRIALSCKNGKIDMEKINWGERVEDLAISVSALRTEYKLREAIAVNLFIKNFGDTPALIAVRSPWIDYSLTVLYEGKAKVLMTPYGNQMTESAALGRRSKRHLIPGEVVSDTFDLDQAYELKSPGLYQVVATRQIFKRGKLDEFATLKSNELDIRILR